MAIAGVDAHIEPEQLRGALEIANIPSLVPVLFQLTGDLRWLQEPYRPTKARGTEEHNDGGLPAEVQREIRVAANDAILAWAAGRPPEVPAPQGAELVALMSLCVGEDVPAEYEPMSAHEMGFRVTERPRVEPGEAGDFTALIIGAGVSGLTASKHLTDMGIAHTVIEKNASVGGTWLENRYPGCGVDTPSNLYSLSFFPRAWTTHFGKRQELETYLEELATHFDLRRNIRFQTTVESATWHERTQQWQVVVRELDGSTQILSANVLLSAVGQLNVPKVPDLPGLDAFTGPVFHSARWPEGLDVTGKRVAVVGTGASAMQIVPAIAGVVSGLDVYQRSPQWVSPNSNYFRPVGEDANWLMANVPYYRAWYRFRLAWLFNDKVHASLQKDPEWPFPERSLNATNDAHRAFFTRYIEDQLRGHPELLERALPSYPPFGKRMLLDNGWYAALREPHVELIAERVTELTPTGVKASDGVERPADVVVLATGFDAHRPVRYEVRGRHGRRLADVWGDDDARAYLGITTPGFPNLFFMYGPNTNLGHGGSFIFLAEAQITYITDAIARMVKGKVTSLECREEVCAQYNAALDAAHQRMVWTHDGMDTWYRNSKGRVVSPMPWRVLDYWTMTRRAHLDDFLVERQALSATG